MKKNEMGVWVPDTPEIFVKPTPQIMSQRKLEGLQKLAEIKTWGIRNPTKYMERFLGVDLLDVQQYVFMSSWDKQYALWLCTRNWGKSTVLGLYYMTRCMLLNNCRCYICAGTSDQSIETFEKIVAISKKEIESFTGLTDVFRNEIVINQTNSDGFIRNPAGFYFRLYNGSFVKTLNSNVNAKRGKRAEAVCFDECGWLDEEVFQVIEPYTAQNKDFKLGGDVDITTLPRELPNQLLYTSSASSVDSTFYQKYRDYSKQMLLGSRKHFVADMNCEIMFNATYKGKIYPASLLTKEKVENAMIENKEKALREYYNQFTSDGGTDAIIKRGQITRNSKVMPPLLLNDTDDKKFIFCYDPARLLDNSVVLISQLYEDPVKGYKLRLCNLANFMDTNKKDRTPLRTPEQIAKLKKLILTYNGKALDYENIYNLAIDAGSGGAGVNIGDYFMEDWYEEGHEGDEKFKHKGLIDKKYSSDYVRQFPNAVDKIILLEPTTYKSIIYEALIEMVTQDLIDFPAEYDGKGYLTMLDVDEEVAKKIRKKLEKEVSNKEINPKQLEELYNVEIEEANNTKVSNYVLTREEEVVLNQMDAMKEEVVNMTRKKHDSGRDSFELSNEKRYKLHDDRAYVLAMSAYLLQQVRREHITKKKRQSTKGLADILPIHQGIINKTIG